MTYLIRKIEKTKWMQNNILDSGVVSADAITNCTKTTQNTLSTWKVEQEDQASEAVLALMSNGQHLDAIDIAILKQEELSAHGLELLETDGQTPVADLIKNHVDIRNLNYKSICVFADRIVECFRAEKVIRYTRSQVKTILISAIENGRLDIDSIHPLLAEKLKD